MAATPSEIERVYVRFLTCDLGDRRCRSGRALEPTARWAALLANPSRP
jgi:hypothetical protein